MFGWIEIIYIILCLIFIGLVLLQNSSGSGLENLTGGNSSSKSKKIGALTKFTASIGLILFAMTFYISYDNKIENEQAMQMEAQILEGLEGNNNE